MFYIQRIKDFLFRKNIHTRKRIVQNITWLVIAQFVSKLAKMFVIIYAARVLGAHGYGIFSYVFGLAGFFVFFKNIGVDGILTREIAKKPKNEEEYISTSFWIEFGLLAVTTILVVLVAPLFSNIEEALPLLPLIALIFIFDDLRDMSIAFFRGKEEMRLEAFIVITWNVATAILGFITLTISPTPASFVLAYLGGSLIGWILSFIFLKQRIKSILKYFNRKLVKPIFKSAWPIAVVGASSVFLFNIDIIMLGWWRDISEIGLYSASQKIIGISGLLVSFVAIATFPVFSRLIKEGKEKIKSALESVMGALFLFAVPITLGGWIVGEKLIRLIFGESFVSAAVPFYILLPTILVTYPLAILTNIIFSYDKQIKIIPIVLISSAVNILLNFFLIQKFGMIGAAIATLVAYSIYTGLMWLYVRSLVHFSVVRQLWKVILSSILMSFVVYLLLNIGVHAILGIIIGIVIYFILLLWMRDKILKEMLSSVSQRFN